MRSLCYLLCLCAGVAWGFLAWSFMTGALDDLVGGIAVVAR